MATLPLPVYPGIALRNGAFGPDTALVQTQLSGLGFPTSIDGIYGASTTQAVRAYQASKGLTPDGVTGYNTWTSLVQTWAAQYPQDPVPYPGVVVGQGTVGSMPKYLQQGLNSLRVLYPAQPQLAGDGVYGSGTAQSVRIFQRQFALAMDGQAGAVTWKKFIQARQAQLAGTPLRVNPAYPGTPLRQGSEGDAVRCIQSYLAVVKQVRGLNYPAPAVDGRFGPTTRNAVLGFQAAFGLKIDGVVGASTWARLVEEFNATL